MSIPRTLASALVLISLAASTAGAVVRPSTPAGAVALPGISRVRIGDPDRQARLEAAAGWQGFRARHGDWRAMWNESTESPHRAYGPPIALTGFSDDPDAVERALRAFVHGNPEVFGPAPALERVAIRRSGATWLARFRQTVRGVPVLFGDWEFRLGASGRLFSFGADVERPDPAVRTTPVLAGAVAREAARQGLRFDPAIDRVEGGRDLFLLPLPTEDGVDYRLVYRVEVRTMNPPGNWLTYVDAANGEVLWRQDRVRFDITGTVTGTIHPNGPNDLPVTRPFQHQSVTVGSNTVTTGPTGAYSGSGPDPASVSAALRGSYVDVNRSDGLDAFFNVSAPNPSTVDIAWGTVVASQDAERDGFYHANVAHDYIRELEPSFTGLDYPMPCAVNIAATCNAYWDGFGINFYAAGDGCPNTATIPDVVYHEYGHGVNDRVYLAFGGVTMDNGALHEGMADVNAAFLRDDPLIGKDFFGAGTSLRNADNTKRWPQDASADPHLAGLIVAGAFWDLRQAVGLAVAEHLAQFAKHYVPDDPDDGVAMFEFFEATLVADDDNADLTDGTPHSGDILAAFNAHGIGSAFWIKVTHAPLADPASGGSIPVTATFEYEGPFGAIDSSSAQIHYAVNRGAFVTTPMPPTGAPNQYAGAISAPGGSVVQYYLTVGDGFGQTAAAPAAAPASVYSFVVGPQMTLASDDMEAFTWVPGAGGDNATSGLWVRGDPVGTYVGTTPIQPELDHTPPPGVACWVTGNGAPGGQPGTADVDGGRTTLTSAVYDATAPGTTLPMMEYYRWYSNNGGASPGLDLWRVDVSNNGGVSWTTVENTNQTDNSWRRVVFRIQDYVIPTNNMKLRFVASDEGAGSLVEAAVDDFRLLAFPTSLLDVEPAGTPVALALGPASPNPFGSRTTLRFTLPAAGAASVRVFDLNGRAVRTLSSGPLSAGPHAIDWDGRDDAGRRLASGAYFVRLEHGGREVVRRVVRME